jgi:hypothetical protein
LLVMVFGERWWISLDGDAEQKRERKRRHEQFLCGAMVKRAVACQYSSRKSI